MSRPSVKVSTSPSTPSAPTTCNSPPGARSSRGSHPQLRFGHIPGNAPTVEGLQRKLEPLSFLVRLAAAREWTRTSQKKALPKPLAEVEIGGIRTSHHGKGERHETRRRMLLRSRTLCGRRRADDEG